VAFRDAERYARCEEPNEPESARRQRELRLLTARIDLLYGQRSSVAYRAREATQVLEDLFNLLNEPVRDEEDDEEFDSRVWVREQRIEREVAAFMSAAGITIRSGGRHPAHAWIRPRVLIVRACVFMPGKWRALRTLKTAQARSKEASRAAEESVLKLEEARREVEELGITEREVREAQEKSATADSYEDPCRQPHGFPSVGSSGS
jgi:hypothetical protein